MGYKLLFAITYLHFKDLDKLDTPLFSITNQQSFKDELLDDQLKAALRIRANQSYSKNTFGFFVSPDETVSSSQMNMELVSRAQTMETFLLFLWFIKDNSISLDQSYGYYAPQQRWFYWSSHIVCSTSQGEFKDTSFSGKEINEAVQLLLKYVALVPAAKDITASYEFEDENDNPRPTLKPSIESGTVENRIQRAFSFLNTARSSAYLPQKITHYMSILECLFSTDGNEVMHKVSERTAYYIGLDKSDRLEIFKTIKSAYDVRSKFVHGQMGTKPVAEICSLSGKVDAVIRTVLKKIVLSDYEIFLVKDKEHAALLLQMVF